MQKIVNRRSGSRIPGLVTHWSRLYDVVEVMSFLKWLGKSLAMLLTDIMG
ncbi:MAG: hypothetical protein AB8B81_11500 [Halioglobus sp.]